MNVKKALGPKPTAMDRTAVRAIRQSNKGSFQYKSSGPRSPAHASGGLIAWDTGSDLARWQKERTQAAGLVKAGRDYARGKGNPRNIAGTSPSFSKGFRSIQKRRPAGTPQGGQFTK